MAQDSIPRLPAPEVTVCPQCSQESSHKCPLEQQTFLSVQTQKHCIHFLGNFLFFPLQYLSWYQLRILYILSTCQAWKPRKISLLLRDRHLSSLSFSFPLSQAVNYSDNGELVTLLNLKGLMQNRSQRSLRFIASSGWLHKWNSKAVTHSCRLELWDWQGQSEGQGGEEVRALLASQTIWCRYLGFPWEESSELRSFCPFRNRMME